MWIIRKVNICNDVDELGLPPVPSEARVYELSRNLVVTCTTLFPYEFTQELLCEVFLLANFHFY